LQILAAGVVPTVRLFKTEYSISISQMLNDIATKNTISMDGRSKAVVVTYSRHKVLEQTSSSKKSNFVKKKLAFNTNAMH